MAYPFRIERRSGIRAQADAPTQPFADYMDRLIKLIPAEILAVYLTVRGFWAPTGDSANSPDSGRPLGADAGFLGWWPLICILLLWISRTWGTRKNADWRTLQIIPILAATISFAVWVFAMGHGIAGYRLEPRLASTFVVIWAFLIPTVYTGSEPGR